MAKWLFLARRPDRPAGGDAFRRTFAKLDPELSLAREAIQNAVDAAPDENKDSVIVEFEFRSDCELGNLLGRPFSDHASAKSFVDPEFVLPVNECRQRGSVLLIHDFGTTGLTGDMRNMHSNFYRLMGGLGGSEKVGGGGSYGFGKAAAILNSQLFTVFAYSVTTEGGLRRKLWGTCYLDPHKVDKAEYLGVGWYCHTESEDSDPILLEDEDADAVAKQLKIDRVLTQVVGTTLALVLPSTDLDKLTQYIRENWWPRIAERLNDANHQLIYVRKGEKRIPITLEGDKRVKPFLALYEVARGLKQPTQAIKRFDITSNKNYGSIKLGVLTLSFEPSESDSEDVMDGIALVRKPRMVVSYYRPRGFPLGMRGIFVADPGMDGFLRKTEPHEHDDWNEKMAGTSLEKERAYAYQVKYEIRKKIREYMDMYTPPTDAVQTLLPELRRFLGTLFSTSGIGPPPQNPQNISITNKTYAVRMVGEELVMAGSARFTNTARETKSILFGVQVKVVESDLGSGGDLLLTRVRIEGASTGPSEKPSLKITLEPDAYVDLRFETNTYNAEWKAKATFWAQAEE